MAQLTDKVYPGKILLFGEYTVIHGGNSLAIPTYRRTANWDYDDLEMESRLQLDQFIDYLVVKGIGSIYIDQFSEEWDKGLFLDSNIPQGYGVGSSGSVVAAVYDSFMEKQGDHPNDIRHLFQQMESYFHGSSSGLDPMVSYFGTGVQIHESEISLHDFEEHRILEDLYLWDSEQTRTTAPLVQWYKEQLSTELEREILANLLPSTNRMIDAFLAEDKKAFKKAFEKVAEFQWTRFKPMFPSEIKKKIRMMKKHFSFSVKLCGAGGGGFYLIHAPELPSEHPFISLVE